MFSKEKILETYKKLKLKYEALVKEDPENRIFEGDFFRILEPHEYKGHVDIERVDVGIETLEHLMNVPVFIEYLRKKIRATEKIFLKTKHEITDIGYSYKDNRYLIYPSPLSFPPKEHEPVAYLADCVVNASWELIDYLNARAGHYDPPKSPQNIRTNRLKVLLKVSFPEELAHFPSMFFCMGEHCMFSNMGDGTGMMTYAKVTNLLQSKALMPEKQYMQYLNGEIDEKEKTRLMREILGGVSEYIPAMKEEAQTLELRFGTVQINGSADTADPKSQVHKRTGLLITRQEAGHFSLASMKFLYGQVNAEEGSNIYANDQDMLKVLMYILNQVVITADLILKGVIFDWMRKMVLLIDPELEKVEKTESPRVNELLSIFKCVDTIFRAKKEISDQLQTVSLRHIQH